MFRFMVWGEGGGVSRTRPIADMSDVYAKVSWIALLMASRTRNSFIFLGAYSGGNWTSRRRNHRQNMSFTPNEQKCLKESSFFSILCLLWTIKRVYTEFDLSLSWHLVPVGFERLT